MHGASSLPERWVSGREQESAEMFRAMPVEGVDKFAAMAARLVELLAKESERHAGRGAAPRTLLDR